MQTTQNIFSIILKKLLHNFLKIFLKNILPRREPHKLREAQFVWLSAPRGPRLRTFLTANKNNIIIVKN